MVEWKGKINGEVGARAAMLDQVENFQVPNFFVITEDETAKLFGDSKDPEKVLNTQLNPSMKSEIKDAYGEIGMSSEVRTADGRAKNLVGGQRNSQLVSVRVSGSEKGVYESRLNIGSSKLVEAIKQVATSYYERNDDHPSIIVQKMVEPDYSGALITDYLGDYGLLEVVEGLGTSLEKGITKPHLYLFRESEIVESRAADDQVKITRNPINGKQKKKDIDSSLPFSDSEVEDFYKKISRQDLNVKFAYKRGSFYIVDAWRPEKEKNTRKDFGRKQDSVSEPQLSAIRVSEGNIDGEAGRDIIYTDQTISPGNYETALISRKGGFTSTDAQKARKAGKPAMFSFEGGLSNGQRIQLKSKEVDLNGGTRSKSSNPFSNLSRSEKVHEEDTEDSSSCNIDQVVASEVLPVDPSKGEGVYISPPFGPGYSVTDRNLREGEAIPESSYLGSYAQIFGFDGEKAVVDTRQLEEQGLEEALEYIEADLKILIVKDLDIATIRVAVENSFDVFAASERQLDKLRQKVLSAEKKFMMEKLREL
jgi:hypothetical protein